MPCDKEDGEDQGRAIDVAGADCQSEEVPLQAEALAYVLDGILAI